MKRECFVIFTTIFAAMITLSCNRSADKPQTDEEFRWVVDTFDDVRVLRYKVPGFEQLPLEEKKLIYYLSEAALSGRDIMFDQNFKYNLLIRRTLEALYTDWSGDRDSDEWKAVEKYLKKVWFANGIHHHYGCNKFRAEFSRSFFDSAVRSLNFDLLPQEAGSVDELLALIEPAIFDPSLYANRVNQADGEDLLLTSAMNYYEGVTQKQAEEFYNKMTDPNDPQPVSYGLNSKLVMEQGNLVEKVWKVGGMYSAAIEHIVYWLEKAASVAQGEQKAAIERLAAYYNTGDLKEFDRFNILWVQDTVSHVDFVNGFTEDYGDPLARKGAWEAIVNFKDDVATERTKTISDNAQWFEDHSPIDDRYKKPEVKGVSAKVIIDAILAGDSYPATPIGINLPNADWIRRDYGSKSVTIQNITDAYAESAKGNGFAEEFVLDPADRQLRDLYSSLGDNLHTDLHECLGHGSGRLAEGTKGNELKQYSSTLEEARADLFGLYYLGDQKLVDLGLIPSLDVAKAQYLSYMMNGLMTQLVRIEPGNNVEEAHMRNRKLIAEWCYQKGKEENVVELKKVDGKTYVVVNDYDKLRSLFGELLREVQRIKSEGDFEAGRQLVEQYAVKVDPALHREVLERYAKLGIQPYSGFINPVYTPVIKNGEVTDIKVEYPDNYAGQMLYYSKNYSFLPSLN